MEGIIQNLVDKDRVCRQKGNTEQLEKDIYKLTQLNFDLSYDYSLPTIISNNDYNKAKLAHRTSKSFKEAFFKDFPIFNNISFQNLLIAGGSVGHYLIDKRNKHSGDIDVFVYGISEADANLRLKQFIREMIQSKIKIQKQEEAEKLLKQGKSVSDTRTVPIQPVVPQDSSDSDENSDGSGLEDSQKKSKKDTKKEAKTMAKTDDFDCPNLNMCFIRNRCGLTLQFGYNEKYQIIFRLYKSISEILHGFDLGPSAVGFNGSEVFLTSLGKFSYEYSAIIIDTTRRSTTYEYRIEKYFGRGFDLILPDLDISKLPTKYLKYNYNEILELPYMPISYRQIIGNKIIKHEFLTKFRTKISEANSNKKGMEDEQTTSDYGLENLDDNEHQLMYLNLYGLLHGGLEKLYYFSKHPSLDILKNPPFISVKSIKYFYETLRRKVFRGGKFNHKECEKYITIVPLSEIVQTLFLNEKVNKNQYLDDIFLRQTNHVIGLLNNIEKIDHSKIPWIVDNPGTQITSSYNPIIEDPKNWYGEFYKSPKA